MAILYDHVIAKYDDSIQPTGKIKWKKKGLIKIPHVEMKKLHHVLSLVIEGPSGSDVMPCVKKASTAAALAAVVAAYSTGGAALPAAEGAFIKALELCLGAKFKAKFNNKSKWIKWTV